MEKTSKEQKIEEIRKELAEIKKLVLKLKKKLTK